MGLVKLRNDCFHQRTNVIHIPDMNNVLRPFKYCSILDQLAITLGQVSECDAILTEPSKNNPLVFGDISTGSWFEEFYDMYLQFAASHHDNVAFFHILMLIPFTMADILTSISSVMLSDLFGTVLRWMGLYLEQRNYRHIPRNCQHGARTQEFVIFKVFVLLGPR
jgi:hypothetical protein